MGADVMRYVARRNEKRRPSSKKPEVGLPYRSRLGIVEVEEGAYGCTGAASPQGD